MYAERSTKRKLYPIRASFRLYAGLFSIHIGPSFTMMRYIIVKNRAGHGLLIKNQSDVLGSVLVLKVNAKHMFSRISFVRYLI